MFITIVEANQLWALRLGYPNYFIVTPKYFGQVGPSSRISFQIMR